MARSIPFRLITSFCAVVTFQHEPHFDFRYGFYNLSNGEVADLAEERGFILTVIPKRADRDRDKGRAPDVAMTDRSPAT